MIRFILCCFLLPVYLAAQAQPKPLPLSALIDSGEAGWHAVQQWIAEAKNDVKVLSVNHHQANESIYQSQLNTHSALGAIVYFTGGILVDHGWIRIFGSGSDTLKRTLDGWNKGKNVVDAEGTPAFYLIADDVVGGFFSINGGAFDKNRPGKIYYLSPDRLKWEPLDLTYSGFLLFCFNGDLVKFYGDMRWTGWEHEVKKLSADKMFHFSPPLWSTQGKDMLKNKKKTITAEEQYQFNMKAIKELKLETRVPD